MSAGGIFSSISDDGKRAFVGVDGFNARLVNGVWERDKIFSADDFKDNFNPVRDETEARRLLNEAKAALSITPCEG